jgi:hypothetical protein
MASQDKLRISFLVPNSFLKTFNLFPSKYVAFKALTHADIRTSLAKMAAKGSHTQSWIRTESASA